MGVQEDTLLEEDTPVQEDTIVQEDTLVQEDYEPPTFLSDSRIFLATLGNGFLGL